MSTNILNKINIEKPILNNDNLINLYETLEKEIEEFLFYHKKNSVATYNSYKSDIKRLAQTLFDREHYKHISKEQIQGFSVSDLVHYFDMCYLEVDEDGENLYTNSTVNRWISSLRSLIKFLEGRKHIKYDIHELNERLKKLPDDSIAIDVLSNEDTDRCLEYFKTLKLGEVMYNLGNLAVDTGLRLNELLTLEWNQFTTLSEDEVQISSRGKNRGKGNKSWNKIISTEVYEELFKLKKEGNTRVFDIGRSTVAKYMNETVTHLGLNKEGKKYTFHSFRKNSVTHIYKTHGNDIIAAQNWANHGSPSTTARYIKSNQLGMAGRKSLADKVDEQAYMKVSHEQLLSTLSEMDESILYNLNKQLSHFVESVTIEKDII